MTPKRSASYPELYTQIVNRTMSEGTWQMSLEEKRLTYRIRSTFYAFARALAAEHDPISPMADKVLIRIKDDGFTLEFEDRDNSEIVRVLRKALGPKYCTQDEDLPGTNPPNQALT